MGRLAITGRILARNSLFNLLGQVLALVAGLVAIPPLLRGLGRDAFGVLSIAWVLLGYFAAFDLGLGRAVTKFVAEALGNGEAERVPGIVWTAVFGQVAFGVVVATSFILLTPTLVTNWLKVPSILQADAQRAFVVLGVLLPGILVSNSLQGALEAAQRFALASTVRFLTITLGFLAPLPAVAAGWGLVGVAAALAVVRCVMLLTLGLLFLGVFPHARYRVRVSLAILGRLTRFGGWVMVSGLAAPILLSIDRLIVGIVFSSGTVANYAIPQEMVIRLYILPVSLAAVLFPAFSSMGGEGSVRIERLLARGMKYLLLVMGPFSLTLFLFAREILAAWVGEPVAVAGAMVLRILAIGILIHSLAFVPWSLFQGLGKPRITTTFQLSQLPVHIGMTWIFVDAWGLTGAALAWSLRAAVDLAYHLVAAMHLRFLSANALVQENLLGGVALVAILGAMAGSAVAGGANSAAKTLLVVVGGSAFAWVVWKRLLDPGERGLLLSVAGDFVRMRRL